MSKLIAIMPMSLDGFVAAPQAGVSEVFDSYVSGDVEFPVGGGGKSVAVHDVGVPHQRFAIREALP